MWCGIFLPICLSCDLLLIFAAERGLGDKRKFLGGTDHLYSFHYIVNNWYGLHTEDCIQQFFCCCKCFHCYSNLFAKLLPSSVRGETHRQQNYLISLHLFIQNKENRQKIRVWAVEQKMQLTLTEIFLWNMYVKPSKIMEEVRSFGNGVSWVMTTCLVSCTVYDTCMTRYHILLLLSVGAYFVSK